jgi:hypothetical protein
MNKKVIILFALLASYGVYLTAQDNNNVLGKDYDERYNVIRTTVSFLTIATDSRSGAMGDAGAASTPDLNSQHWNPAKYMFMKQRVGFALSYTPWLKNLGVNDLNLAYAAGYFKFDSKQAISLGLRYFNLGEIPLTGPNAEPLGTSKPMEYAIDAGYSRLFSEYFSGALVFRFIYSDIAAGTGGLNNVEYNPGVSVAADLAVYYQHPLKIDKKEAEYAFGIDISNIGTKMAYSDGDKKEFIPTNLRLGGRFSINLDDYNKISIIADLNKLLVPTPPIISDSGNYIIAGENDTVGTIQGIVQSFYDAPGGFKEEMHEIAYSIGCEYWYRNQFAIRAGYYNENETKGDRKFFTAGVGLRLNVFSLDFSYLIPTIGSRSPLANTMRFTIGFVFE